MYEFWVLDFCHSGLIPEKKNLKEDSAWLMDIEVLTHSGESGRAQQFTTQQPENKERG